MCNTEYLFYTILYNRGYTCQTQKYLFTTIAQQFIERFLNIFNQLLLVITIESDDDQYETNSIIVEITKISQYQKHFNFTSNLLQAWNGDYLA